MKKNISVIIMHASFFFNASAQINESDKSKFQLSVKLNGSYQKGSVEVFTVKSKLDIVYSPVVDFVFKSQNSHLYQEFYSKKADNDIFSRNYFYYKPQNKVYPFGIGYILQTTGEKLISDTLWVPVQRGNCCDSKII